jgi:hypothetical protein
MKRIALIAALLLALPHRPAMAQGEGIACTQMWCQEGLNVTLDGADWLPGVYTFTITADGQETVCTSRLPFPGCNGNSMCSGEGVVIGESGCAMPPKAHSFHAVTMPKTPKTFSLTIVHESGKTLSFGPEEVTAQCSYPNGPQCDPHPCCSAKLVMDVVWK